MEEQQIPVSREVYERFALLRARLSARLKRKLTWDETVELLLERQRRKNEIISWAYSVAIFVAITWLLLWPVYVFAPALIPLMYAIGLVIAAVSVYILGPWALRTYKPFADAPAEVAQSVEELAAKAGMKNLPVLTVSETEEINAMAYCGIPRGRVCLTRGLIRAYEEGRFSLAELRAIIAHEIAHLKHQDLLKFGLALSWANVFEYAGNESVRMGVRMANASEGEDEGAFAIVTAIAGWFSAAAGSLLLLLAKLASALSLHLSRRHELEADDTAAELTRPGDMAAALEKITTMNAQLEQRELDRLPYADRWQIQPRNTTWADRLWDTHPPSEVRVARQRSLAAAL
ncbi:MAG TPA: hypothetical protein ENN53_01085 [Candidatus Acetothermia bacterium]|nr:hypothetical protein [Candidatus Acetothermia bacterium]